MKTTIALCTGLRSRPKAVYEAERHQQYYARKENVVGRQNKNSSGDEIANVNFFTTLSHTYFKIPQREPTCTLFNTLDDSYRQVLRINS